MAIDQPFFLNTVEIRVRKLRRPPSVTLDPVYREPVGPDLIENAELVLDGQINFGNRAFERRARTFTGDEDLTEGHAVFRKFDLDAAGVTIEKGDRIVKVAGRAHDLEIIEVRFESPLDGDYLLVYVPFIDNSEVKGGLR